jgi:DegV family protein with EDD domain
MSKLTISVDSTADLNQQMYEQHNIHVVPLGVVIGDVVYRDWFECTPVDVYTAVEKRNLVPKSNAALEVDYYDLFKKCTEDGGDHIHFSISSKLSTSYNNACRAAKEFKNVHVIDSLNLSAGTGVLALIARELGDAGKNTQFILKQVESLIRRIRVSFMLETLKYMHKGGRCSGFKFLAANMLGIHPMLKMEEDGKLIQGKLFRGKYPMVLRNWAQHIIDTYPNADHDAPCFVSYSDIDKALVEQVTADMKAAGFKRVINTTVGSVITTHCGRGTIGILLIEKEKK